jgi:hypothetical protein
LDIGDKLRFAGNFVETFDALNTGVRRRNIFCFAIAVLFAILIDKTSKIFAPRRRAKENISNSDKAP